MENNINSTETLPCMVDGLRFTLINGNTEYEVSSESASGTIIIPAAIRGIPVTKIAGYAFATQENVTEITIPASVINIGEGAFFNCINLSKIHFEKDSKLETIGDGAFNSCGIDELKLPFNLKSIGTGAFGICKNIMEINIPQSVVNMGANVFLSWDSNCKIYIQGYSTAPDGWDKNWLKYCSAQVVWAEEASGLAFKPLENGIAYEVSAGNASGIVEIPGTYKGAPVVKIADDAFCGRSDIIEVNIPKEIFYIGKRAFYNCSNLESVNVSSENSYYSSANGVLFNKYKTNLLTCPSKRLGKYRVPNTGKAILSYAFANCQSPEINIPSSIVSIGANAFEGCTNAQTITIEGCSSTPETWDPEWKAGSNAQITFIPTTTETVGAPENTAQYAFNFSDHYTALDEKNLNKLVGFITTNTYDAPLINDSSLAKLVVTKDHTVYLSLPNEGGSIPLNANPIMGRFEDGEFYITLDDSLENASALSMRYEDDKKLYISAKEEMQ